MLIDFNNKSITDFTVNNKIVYQVELNSEVLEQDIIVTSNSNTSIQVNNEVDLNIILDISSSSLNVEFNSSEYTASIDFDIDSCIEIGNFTSSSGGTSLPEGGLAGQVLSKNSDLDQDVIWSTIESSNIEYLTEEEYNNLEVKDSKYFYIIVDNNKIQKIYIGTFLFAQRGEVVNKGFPYTFPIIFQS